MKRVNKFLLLSLVSSLFLFFFVILSRNFIAQLYYQIGKAAVEKKEYESAIFRFKKSVRFNASDYLYWEALGEAYRLASNRKPLDEALNISVMAKGAFQKATALNSLEPDLWINMAAVEADIEKLSLYTGKDLSAKGINPLPHFQRAIELAPNTVQYRLAFADYLYSKYESDHLKKTIRELGRIHPPSHDELQEKPYWSKEFETAFKDGLEEAINVTSTRMAGHRVLSDILEDEKRFQDAIAHFHKYMNLKPEIDPYDNRRLGELYLKANDINPAKETFFAFLSESRNKSEALEAIFQIFDDLERLDDFLPFLNETKAKKNLLPEADLLAARAHIKLKNFSQAKDLLTALSRRKSSGESYYLLAEIAEEEKDWDSMETFIQKSTLHDPKNYWYHLKFSEALERQEKFDDSEKEAGLAILYSTEPRAWLFNHRAWIRWEKEDYPGAFSDWENAIKIEPGNPDYLKWAGDALYRMGKWEEALPYFKKALAIDPKDIELKEKFDALMKDIQRIQG